VSIRALVWDFDGLFVDSEMADCTAWRDEFERAAVAISMATYAGSGADCSQHRRSRMIDRLVAAAPHVDRTVVEARRLARYRELCADLPPSSGCARSWPPTTIRPPPPEGGPSRHLALRRQNLGSVRFLTRRSCRVSASEVFSARIRPHVRHRHPAPKPRSPWCSAHPPGQQQPIYLGARASFGRRTPYRATWWANHYGITCAAARGPRAIAADIGRRLLPAYHAELDKVLQAIADHLDNLDQQAATATAVAAAIPGASSYTSGNDHRVRTPYEPGGKVSADFRITDSGSRLTVIEIQLHSLEHARRAAELAVTFAAKGSVRFHWTDPARSMQARSRWAIQAAVDAGRSRAWLSNDDDALAKIACHDSRDRFPAEYSGVQRAVSGVRTVMYGCGCCSQRICRSGGPGETYMTPVRA
jgi:hypothetical protein